MSQPCPCGLPYEHVYELKLVGPDGLCRAVWKDRNELDDQGNRKICGESLANHPHVQLQTAPSALPSPPTTVYAVPIVLPPQVIGTTGLFEGALTQANLDAIASIVEEKVGEAVAQFRSRGSSMEAHTGRNSTSSDESHG